MHIAMNLLSPLGVFRALNMLKSSVEQVNSSDIIIGILLNHSFFQSIIYVKIKLIELLIFLFNLFRQLNNFIPINKL